MDKMKKNSKITPSKTKAAAAAKGKKTALPAQEGGVIKDATGSINGTTNGITIKTLDAQIAIN